MPVALWEHVGGFRDDFFIDHVDDEFCLRVRRAGGRVWRLNKSLIEHRIGDPSRSRWALNHPPLRWFYMVRNHIWTIRMHFLFDPVWALYTIALKARLVVGTLSHEDRVIPKARQMARGLWQGMARAPEEQP